MISKARPAILIGLLLLAVFTAFTNSAAHLHTLWLDNDNGYTHGYLVLFISLFLLIKQIPELITASIKPSALAFIALTGSTIAWCLAEYLNIAAIQIPLLIPITWFAIGSVMGLSAMRITAFPVLFILFALPIWDLLLPVLQNITVFVSRNVLQEIGITAIYHGATVTLPYGNVIIEESCSGLRYLTISLTLGTLYHYLYCRQTPSRGFMVVLLAILFALASNWIRVIYIIYVAFTTKMQHPLVSDHHDFGWMLYAASLVPFFLIANYLQPSLSDKSESSAHPNNSNSSNSASNMHISIALCLTTACIFLAPLYTHALQAKHGQAHTLSLENSEWSKIPRTVSPTAWSPIFNNVDSEEHFYLVSNNNPSIRVSVDRYTYHTQYQDKEMISDLNHIVLNNKWINKSLTPITSTNIELPVTQVKNRWGRTLVSHWYQVADTVTSNRRKAKLLELKNLVGSRQSSSAWVISINCSKDCTTQRQALAAAHTAIAKASESTDF